MKVRLLVNTREHPTGAGKVFDVEADQVAQNPRFYKPIEEEERERAAAAVRAESVRQRTEAERTERAHSIASAETGRLRGLASYLRSKAAAAAELAAEAERQAEAAEVALQRQQADLPGPAAAIAPKAAEPPSSTDQGAPAPHRRARFGGSQVIEAHRG